MEGITHKYHNWFKNKNILIKLIVVNVSVFIILSLLHIIAKLFVIGVSETTRFFAETTRIVALSSDIHLLVRYPWTIASYMFVHQSIFHLFFNMICLYWFGNLFLSFSNSRSLGSLYFMGGIMGGIIFLLSFNIIPFYRIMFHESFLIGSSASVMAIIMAVGFYQPNMKINLFLFGSIKILYIALIIFGINLLSLESPINPGGAVAHIGGAIVGYLFAIKYRKGIDITSWISKIFDGIANFFKFIPELFKSRRKKKVRIVYQKKEKEKNSSKSSKGDNRLDEILDKIKISGYESLTSEEKDFLFNASNKKG